MGIFDTISVNIDLLPISGIDKKRLSGESFQTKSLDNSTKTKR
jgi:hypothetical protein